MNYSPQIMNFELTTLCPLMCPQCYCSLNTGKSLDIEKARYWVDEAAKNGIRTLNLSGGETLCYPHLYELIKFAASKGLQTNIALSGYGFTKEVYKKLVEAGVSNIFISLNGSTDEINKKSRNGYHYAISALQLLKDEKNHNSTINWVMQKSNSDDFPALVTLAENYNVSRIVVISLKPDSKKDLQFFPTKEQIEQVASYIRRYRGSVDLNVESCFPQLIEKIYDSYFFNGQNNQQIIGCLAGRANLNLNVDGKLSPCRHIDLFEDYTSIAEYWEKSEILKEIRSVDDHKQEPCKTCYYSEKCRHCLAITGAISEKLYLGFEDCPIYRSKR